MLIYVLSKMKQYLLNTKATLQYPDADNLHIYCIVLVIVDHVVSGRDERPRRPLAFYYLLATSPSYISV